MKTELQNKTTDWKIFALLRIELAPNRANNYRKDMKEVKIDDVLNPTQAHKSLNTAFGLNTQNSGAHF